MLGAAHRAGRVADDDLADDKPIEKHADGGQMLLDRRRGEVRLKLLDIGRDMDRFHIDKIEDASLFAPIGKSHRGVEVRAAGVRVADVGGEELDEAGTCPFTGSGIERRDAGS